MIGVTSSHLIPLKNPLFLEKTRRIRAVTKAIGKPDAKAGLNSVVSDCGLFQPDISRCVLFVALGLFQRNQM